MNDNLSMNCNWFIQQGWKCLYEHDNIFNFEKGDVWKDNGSGAFLEFNSSNNMLKITTTDKGYNQDGPNFSIKFNGKCENIETYIIICELIMLKV